MPWWYTEVTKPSDAEIGAMTGVEKGTARAEAGDASAAASGAASEVASTPEVSVDGGFFLRV